MQAGRGCEHDGLGRRPVRRIVAVDLVAGRAADEEAVVPDQVGLDAVEDPGVLRVTAGGCPPVARCAVGRVALGCEPDSDQAIRVAAAVAPQAALLAGLLVA